MNEVWPYVIALVPSIGLLYLFWYVMKNIMEADRVERAAIREWEAAHPGQPEQRGQPPARDDAPREVKQP